MPCYSCGRVQTDPQPGQPFEWVVGVKDRSQVLVCPECRREHPEVVEALDSCPRCGSPRLKVMLGSVICKACGADS